MYNLRDMPNLDEPSVKKGVKLRKISRHIVYGN
jgi:hypothetical protein